MEPVNESLLKASLIETLEASKLQINNAQMALISTRDIDAIIAEDVFGWRWDPKKNQPGWCFGPGESIRGSGTPEYCTNMKDAWSVVQTLLKLGIHHTLADAELGYTRCTFHFTNHESKVFMESVDDAHAPMAICRAAILIMQVRKHTL